ncbi:MAG TPA: alpha/beta fold hydrolase [Urbifossiella sp.]|jgi:pimeloyl-ACP methyl ester carboxylesterase|nr:alpha/beta fold hydrolase [Urbifossiella sp.]
MTLAYTDTAAGPTLLLLHAFPLDREMWRPQLAALAGAARVLAVDLPGFGRSPLPAEPWSVDTAADAVAALLDALGLTGRLVVGGLSMGGYVAMAFARRHPDRLAGLILADTRADPDDAAAKENRGKMIATARKDGAAAVVGAMVPKLLSDATRESRPDVADGVRTLGERQTADGVAAGLAALRDRPDAGPGLDALAVPTLVLVGEHDAVTPPTLAAAIAGRVYGSELVTIPGAGHLSNLENPEAFNAAVGRFLAERTPAVKPARV